MSSSEERAASIVAKHLDWARKFVLLYVIAPNPRRSQQLWEQLGQGFVRMRLHDLPALADAAARIDALLDDASAEASPAGDHNRPSTRANGRSGARAAHRGRVRRARGSEATRLRAWVRVGDHDSWARAQSLADAIELPDSTDSEPDRLARRELGRSLNEFAEVARSRGELESAQRAWERVAAIFGQANEPDPAATLLAAEAALGLAELHASQDALGEAKAALDRAAALDQQIMRTHSSPLTLRLALTRAELARREGKLDVTRFALERVIGEQRGPGPLLELGRVLAQLGEHAHACEALREADNLATGESPTMRVSILAELAAAARALGNLVEAVELWTRAEQLAADDDELLLACLEARARLLEELDDRERANIDRERARELRARSLGPL